MFSTKLFSSNKTIKLLKNKQTLYLCSKNNSTFFNKKGEMAGEIKASS